MAVTQGQFSKWPENVAFKRMIRELLRAQQYVPPKQQPTGTASSPESTDAASASTPANLPATPVRIGNWTLDQSTSGDLIARHTSGHEVTIAAIPQGEH